MADRASDLNATHWTEEGLAIAKDKIYPFMANSNVISESTRSIWFDIARERVALGGYRLANLISAIYRVKLSDI
jgi:hypothetical protein